MTLVTDELESFMTYTKYAKYLEKKLRRENYTEIVQRSMEMHMRKFPKYALEIEEAFEFVFRKEVLPSMRSMQFAGGSIEQCPSRIYNCGYDSVTETRTFSEIMFLLLGGTGLGYSVQDQHVADLPPIRTPEQPSRRYLVGDSVEGWSAACEVLFDSYTIPGKKEVRFDLSDIRPKGSRLVMSGGKAPGPEPFRQMLVNIKRILDESIRDNGGELDALQVSDIICHMAEVISAGGIRRAALISIFSKDNAAMLLAKSGKEWFADNPQRRMANNSIALKRGDVTKEEFYSLLRVVQNSGSGEPGILWLDNMDSGFNPCGEIALLPGGLCNLVEINAATITTQKQLEDRARAASFIATLQATYTDFHFLRPEWKKTAEDEALIGVSLTGIVGGKVLDLDPEAGVCVVMDTNAVWASRLGINPAARTTCVKPAGSTSLLLGGVSSGIHAYPGKFYIRRCTIEKGTTLYNHLYTNVPHLLEDSLINKNEAYLNFPMRAPEGAKVDESAVDTLYRIADVMQCWVMPGHRRGNMQNNVSATVYVKDDEWDVVINWMWGNRDLYSGIALLPYYGGNHPQLILQRITEEKYNELVEVFTELKLHDIVEYTDDTNLQGELACAGGACEI